MVIAHNRRRSFPPKNFRPCPEQRRGKPARGAGQGVKEQEKLKERKYAYRD